MPFDLAGKGAQAFAVQALDGALHQWREVLTAPRESQRFGEEGDRIGGGHGLDQGARIVARRLRPQRRLFVENPIQLESEEIRQYVDRLKTESESGASREDRALPERSGRTQPSRSPGDHTL